MSADADSPPTELVLLHGFTNTGASWDPVVAGLPATVQAHAPDIRGHGSASGARPVTLEAVLAEIDALAPARFALAGYSQGGRIALHAALALGERIERLFLIGASPGLADPAEREQRRAAPVGLDHRGGELGRCGSGGAGDCDRSPARPSARTRADHG